MVGVGVAVGVGVGVGVVVAVGVGVVVAVGVAVGVGVGVGVVVGVVVAVGVGVVVSEVNMEIKAEAEMDGVRWRAYLYDDNKVDIARHDSGCWIFSTSGRWQPGSGEHIGTITDAPADLGEDVYVALDLALDAAIDYAQGGEGTA